MFTLLFGVTAFAAPIKKIEVINNMGVPKEVIISSIEMKEGAEFSQDKSAQDINRLKAMKYFNDVNIQTKDVEDGVEVYIDVKEKENVNDLLKKDGLLVSNDTIPMDTKAFTVSNIRISGLKNISRSEFLDLANIKEGSVVNERKLIDVKARIAFSGYFRSADIKVKEGQTLEIVVLENPIIKDVIVEGGSLYTGDQIKSLLGIEAGKILNLNDLKEAGEKVKALYNKDGFVLCGISDVYTDEAGVLHIKVTEGIVRKIEAKKMITIQKGARRKPNDDKLKTADHVIDREVVIQKDRIFNIKDFDQTANNLMRLGIFRNIKYEARGIEGDPNGVVITLLIDEDRTASIQGGISYGTESGLMGSASVKDTNWAGKNQEVEFSIEKSTKTGAKINISFFDPWIKGTDRVSWGWGAYKRTYGNPSTVFNTTKVLGGRLNIGKGVNRNLSFNIGAKSEYLQEFPNSEIFQHVSADGKAIVEVPDKDQSFNKKFYDLKDKLTENIGQQPNEKIKENITKMIETLNDENKIQEIENNLNPADLKENIQKLKRRIREKLK